MPILDDASHLTPGSGKKVRVELETLSSHFTMHNHRISDVDEVICIKNDLRLGVPTIEIDSLKYQNKIKRISATVDSITYDLIMLMLKDGTDYRNKSHVIEEAIKFFWEQKQSDKVKK